MTDLPSSQQRDVIKAISPPWLAQGTNEKYMYNFGLACDALLEKLNQAVKAHMPGLGTPTALPYIGRDRVMVQGPYEDNDNFATRLSKAFDTWQRAGSARAVMGQAMTYVTGFDAEEAGQAPRCVIVGTDGEGVYTNWHTYFNTSDLEKAPAYIRKDNITATSGVWDWDGEYLYFRRWLVLFFGPGSTIEGEETWGNGTWGESDGSWGFNIESTFFDVLRGLVRLWKSASTYYPWFIFSFNGGDGSAGYEFSPNSVTGAGNPDGTWGTWGTTIDGAYIPSRPDDCRFVDGTGYYDNCSVHTGI